MIAYFHKFSITCRKKFPFQVLVLRKLEPKHHVHLFDFFLASVTTPKRCLHAFEGEGRRGGTHHVDSDAQPVRPDLWIESVGLVEDDARAMGASSDVFRQLRAVIEELWMTNVRSTVHHRCCAHRGPTLCGHARWTHKYAPRACVYAGSGAPRLSCLLTLSD